MFEALRRPRRVPEGRARLHRRARVGQRDLDGLRRGDREGRRQGPCSSPRSRRSSISRARPRSPSTVSVRGHAEPCRVDAAALPAARVRRAPQPTRPWIVPMCVAYDARRQARRGVHAGRREQPTRSTSRANGVPALGDAERQRPRLLPRRVHDGAARPRCATRRGASCRGTSAARCSSMRRRRSPTGKVPLQLALSFVPKLLAGNDRFTVPRGARPRDRPERLVPDRAARQVRALAARDVSVRGDAQAGFVPKDSESARHRGDAQGARSDAVAWTAREPKLVAEAVEARRAAGASCRRRSASSCSTIAVDARPEVFERDPEASSTRRPIASRRGEMFGALGSASAMRSASIAGARARARHQARHPRDPAARSSPARPKRTATRAAPSSRSTPTRSSRASRPTAPRVR